MFVVADELAVRIGRKGRLARARQAEEDSRFLGDRVHVGRAVHGQDAFVGQEVIHDGKDALLDFPGITRAGDEDGPRFVVDEDGRLRVRAVDLGVTLEARGDEDGEIRFAVLGQLFGCRPDEEVADEETFAGQFIDDAEFLAALLVGTGKAVEEVNGPVLEISQHLALEGIEFFFGNGPVDVVPGDVVVDGRRIDDEFVIRCPAGIFAGPHDKGPGIAEDAFLIQQGLLRQPGRRHIAVYYLRIYESHAF